jgi:hypothetical protein
MRKGVRSDISVRSAERNSLLKKPSLH